MRTFPLFSAILLSAAVLTVSLPVSAQGDNNRETREQKEARRKAKLEARRSNQKMTDEEKKAMEEKAAMEALIESYKKGGSFDFTKEFKALKEAASILAELPPDDEKAAERAAKKIGDLFQMLPAPTGASEQELELWASMQNKVNDQMERFMNLPYFESSGLQTAWSLATDPYSRRRESKTR